MIALAAAFMAISFTSCSFFSEPNEDDYIKMAQYYDVEEIGIVGDWTSGDGELAFEFYADQKEGYNVGWKHMADHENPIQIYWQVVKYEHPSEYSYGRDLTHTGGYVRILGKNYVGNTWLFEMMEDGTMELTSPSGKKYKMERANVDN